MEEAPLQVVVGALTVWLLQGLKGKSQDPQVQRYINLFCRSMSAFGALCTSVGITWGIDGSLSEGGRLIISFPSIANLIMHFGEQFVGQEALYQGLQVRQTLQRIEKLGMLNTGQFKAVAPPPPPAP